ncbi:THAP domain-containing protein 1 isoform X1 [Nilaparvata lugens]|uniref:THAP domain-containing protein 1 isoform X2 n=1 Tax=Nilaparvata lugens TaxID=108931 RepID=UPI00193E75C2|nr:THAP domain-containing protein 1 isoform X2 [Nilaparvata lugens]XP_039278140.1 THAP domain-containing protein 1 isoform X1 [Nilaparvata lugens]XP_039278141.1 THAP domain-containing protein 1 isoform X1 [Nilaparvata lugens]
MVIKCSVLGCDNQYTLDNNIAFFRFPLDDRRLLIKWLTAMRRRDFWPKIGSTICSEHFRKIDLLKVTGENKPRLRVFAVPSIFPEVTYTQELLSPGDFLDDNSPDILFPRERDLPEDATYTEKLSLVSLDQDPPEEVEISTQDAASQTSNSLSTRNLIATAESKLLLQFDESSQTIKDLDIPVKSPADKIRQKIKTVRRKMGRRSKSMLCLKNAMMEKGSFNSEIEMLWSEVYPE